MRVPYDVLLAILDIQSWRADVQTISSMSQTCQVLRSAGVRHLLAHPIDLRDSRGVTSFNSFMHAERGRRFSLLRRRLAITTGSLPPDAAEALVELVCKISHLERLVLLDAEHLLASDPRLPRAFAALTCLKHIEFSAAQESDNSDCVYMFKRMRSQLASATLHLPSSTRRWLNGRLNCELADPVGLLRNSASTLTELRGTSFEARRHNVIYPHVKRLQVQFGLLPDISPYIIAYPNITSLDVTSSSTFDVTTLPSFCWMNEDAQQRVGCWSTLEELGGDLADLYVISLRCRAESLRVSARGRRGVLHYLTEVLSRAQPARLRLEIDSSALLASEDSSLAAVFQRTEASKCIRELDLRIVQTQGDGRADVDVLFVRASSSCCLTRPLHANGVF